MFSRIEYRVVISAKVSSPSAIEVNVCRSLMDAWSKARTPAHGSEA